MSLDTLGCYNYRWLEKYYWHPVDGGQRRGQALHSAQKTMLTDEQSFTSIMLRVRHPNMKGIRANIKISASKYDHGDSFLLFKSVF